MPLTYKQIIKIINDFWFKKIRIRGSHYRFELNWKWITIPFHKEFPPKTSQSILKDISNFTKTDYKEIIKKYNIKL